MLCCVCLIENRESANKAVTYMQGSSVCREHLVAAASQQRDGQNKVVARPAAQVLKAVMTALATQRNGDTSAPVD